jgi:hypothetical protein
MIKSLRVLNQNHNQREQRMLEAIPAVVRMNPDDLYGVEKGKMLARGGHSRNRSEHSAVGTK